MGPRGDVSYRGALFSSDISPKNLPAVSVANFTCSVARG